MKFQGGLFGGEDIVFTFIYTHLRRRLEWITKASRRFNSGWATRHSKETGLGLTVLTYHGKDKYRTSQIIQYQNVEAKYIFLPKYVTIRNPLRPQSQRGRNFPIWLTKIPQFQVLLAVAGNDLWFVIKPNSEKVQGFIYVL